MRAVLSIGSNMDDRYHLIHSVIEDFAAETIASSQIYSTPPWGVIDQEEFLNAVIIVEMESSPRELLRRAQQLENNAARVRTKRWGPRTLDVDIVQVFSNGVELVQDDPELILPHPWAHDRAFVLVPWLEADPQAKLKGIPLAVLLSRLDARDIEAVEAIDGHSTSLSSSPIHS
ncbi:2-amino-4-hydroxy-6-hydroxymethyldihydropteridine diphosphokinase [Corynebacterium sp. ES2715-CONJ3]|uniref:2-amino-4-hydroxy-6- hydroxymethyldihydropteridine diphosphokinase n=1 Tax=Corynebacterium sp. ES2715-CONJ3 TaxID=2974028 RepID=UPI0021680E2F|nr:2-amino-4-hydroxy-6-hydroxymethyldihydropteridine diphosphokinase [Corynebacterium sp. ES2715-CONJ3]MCS4491945.1 2-amino-4-hydroxy-6-hydroxymethyldihydropteridine diphosphokinase [Corynebacterium sp. ES2715-CONJ3]